jgi:TRAP-type mannitol/chloroaromatic compound transport system permease small subunit
MLALIGDILNWAIGGLVFPLMILPLAAHVAPRGRAAGAIAYLALVGAVAGAGLAFAALAPRLTPPLGPREALPFAAGAAALALLVALAGGPRPATRRLAGVFGAIARAVGRAAVWLVIAMTLVQFSVVILRYVFGINSILMQESVTYMHGTVFLLAAGYALITDDHVRVDIFYRNASPRRKALVDFLGTYVFLFPTALLILATASGYVAQSWSVFEGSSEQSGIRGVFLLKSLVPAFAALVAMAGFSLAARAGETLRGEG